MWGFDSDNGYGIKYDANGNIQMMIQAGLKGGSSGLVDALRYTYLPNSNKLQQVTDDDNDKDSKLGDFHYDPATKTGTDYTYDANGNLTQDKNKGISSITYNYLNLPEQITMTGKGTITYTYDAAGTKLEKYTVDNTVSPAKTSLSFYMGPCVYRNDTLQFIGHEEGRARWAYHKYATGTTAYGFEYDFFEKDHLGNTRVVLTQQKDTAGYAATGEAAYRATESQLFDSLASAAVSRITAPGYPNDISLTNPNDTVFKVNGTTGGHKMGPALLLKVMSGDKVDIGVQSYYNSGTTGTPVSSLTDVLASLANGVVNLATGGKGSLTDLNNTTTSPIYAALNSFITNKDTVTPGKPKAYLNWILLDEQLKYVNSYPQSGAITVGAPGILNSLSNTGIPITKSGFLYIWVSNETPNWDAFFDNLVVKHYTGPLLEETHYYPFGLTMAGISSKALKPYYAENKYRFNRGSELQNKEFSDGSGLELYETHYRMLDPQIGRWNQIDPKCEASINPEVAENENEEDEAEVGGLESMSPYTSMGNNPIKHNDPNGDIFGIDNLVGAVVGAAVEIGTQVVSNAISGEELTNISWGKVGVAAVEGFVTDGASNVTKALVKVGGAIVNSAIDNHGKGVGKIAKGAVINLAINKVAGGASKLTKGVGGKQLNKVANKIVGGKSRIIKNIVANNNISHKTASAIAKVVRSGEKAVANKVVKEAPQKLTEAIAGGAADAAQKKIIGQQ